MKWTLKHYLKDGIHLINTKILKNCEKNEARER